LKESLALGIDGEVVNLIELAGMARREHQHHDVFPHARRRVREGADREVFDFVGQFHHRRQSNFGDDMAGKLWSGIGCGGAGPKLQRPRALVGGGMEQREHRVEMDRVTIQAVTMWAVEPSQLDGRSLS